MLIYENLWHGVHTDVLVDKSHPRFDAKILRKRCSLYTAVYGTLIKVQKKFWLQNKKSHTCGETITTGGGLGLSLGSWIGSAF